MHAGISVEWYVAEDDRTLHVQQRSHRPKPSQKLSQAAGNKRKAYQNVLATICSEPPPGQCTELLFVLKIYGVLFYQIKISAANKMCTRSAYKLQPTYAAESKLNYKTTDKTNI